MKSLQSRPGLAKNLLAVLAVLLVSIIGVKLLTGSQAATGATLSLSSSTAAVTPGANMAVTIKSDSGTDPVNSIQAQLNYDSTQLQFVSLSEGTAFPTVAATDTSKPGIIRISRANQGAPVSGSNNVVTVNFKVLATTGKIDLSFDKNFSFVVNSTTNSDILTATTGSTYTVSGTTTASASMSLSPAAITTTSGSNIAVTVRESSGTAIVNSVQSAVTYDSTKLQYVGINEGGVFTNVAATDSATAGKVRLARSVQAGSTGVSGDNAIATLNFKVLAASGTASLALDKTQSFVVASSNNGDILATVAGNTVTINAATSTKNSTFSLSPASGTYANGTNVAVTVKVNSTANLTTVQPVIKYASNQLQFVSVTEGTAFTTVQRTNSATAGTVDIVRAIPGGNAGVTGSNTVVTLNFKVIGTTGTAAVTLADNSAAFDDSGTGTNVLNFASSTGAVYTVTGGTTPPNPTTGKASLNLSPATGQYKNGDTIAVTVKANSTSPMTTVQSVLTYPSAQLQYVSTAEGNVFTTAQRTNTATAGVVDVIRSVAGGSAGVTGSNNVVTITFKVVGNSGTIALGYGTGTAVYDNSGTGVSILDGSTSTGASYTVTTTTPPVVCSDNPTTPGTVTRTSYSYQSQSLSWTAAKAGANCTLAGYHVYRNGTAVGDVTNGTTFNDSGLSVETAYSYTVKAFDTAGHTSAASTAASFTTRADDMAPSVPTAFNGNAVSAVSVNLNWGGSTDLPNPGGSGVAGYKLYRNNSLTATYTVTSGLSYTDANVSPNTTYSYTITSYDKKGNESAPSNVVTVKTPAVVATCTGNPSAPATLTASGIGMNGLTLGWTASTPASGCTIAGYRVFRGGSLVGTATSLSFTDGGLVASTSYNYTVQAFDNSGHTSTLSTAKTVVTSSDTAAPTAPATVTAVATSAGQVTVNWSKSTDNLAVVGYKVYRGGSLVKTVVGTTATSYSDTTVTANSSYSYAVSAYDAANNESARTKAVPDPVKTPAATDTTAPSTPANLQTIMLTSTSATIVWTASSDASGVTGYHIYRNGTLITDKPSPTYTATDLTANTQYSFTVKAFDAAGNTSASSAALSIKTLAAPVTVVGDVDGDGTVTLRDLSTLLSHWNEIKVPVKFGDLNQDGIVDVKDLSILLSHLGDKA